MDTNFNKNGYSRSQARKLPCFIRYAALMAGLSAGMVVNIKVDGKEVSRLGSTQNALFYSHGDPTDFEQLMLELVNRARNNPGAEAARLGIELNEGLADGTIQDTPKQPLVFNPLLFVSARNHSDWMLAENTFSHTGEKGSSTQDRMEATGYPFAGTWSSGENISWGGGTNPVDPESSIRNRHKSLFRSPPHRTNISNGIFREIGIGARLGRFLVDGVNWEAQMVTQNFTFSSHSPDIAGGGVFIQGVIYDDANGNQFYDPGEGISGITVEVPGGEFRTETSSSGGYALPIRKSAGEIVLNIDGGPFSNFSKVGGTIGDRNIKVDVLSSETVSNFGTWIAGFSSITGDNSAPTSDPDLDGLSNLIEYALGGNPDSADSAPRPQLKINQGRLVFVFTRVPGLSDVNLRVERTDRLAGDWNEIGQSNSSSPFSLNDGGKFELQEVDTPVGIESNFIYMGEIDTISKLFIGLKVIQNTP